MTARRQALRALAAKRQGLVVPGPYELIGVNAQLALAERYRDDDRSAT
ncbi:MAG TPA: hypothetical protein VET45_15180 [Candidatus Binatia bacterium]|nr:hypothetical protein [Candidatus Binatia bacterium]